MSKWKYSLNHWTLKILYESLEKVKYFVWKFWKLFSLFFILVRRKFLKGSKHPYFLRFILILLFYENQLYEKNFPIIIHSWYIKQQKWIRCSRLKNFMRKENVKGKKEWKRDREKELERKRWREEKVKFTFFSKVSKKKLHIKYVAEEDKEFPPHHHLFRSLHKRMKFQILCSLFPSQPFFH